MGNPQREMDVPFGPRPPPFSLSPFALHETPEAISGTSGDPPAYTAADSTLPIPGPRPRVYWGNAYEILSDDSSAESSDSDSLLSDEDPEAPIVNRSFNWLWSNYRAAVLEKYNEAPLSIKLAIGPNRFFDILFDALADIPVDQSVPFDDYSHDIFYFRDSLPKDDESKYCTSVQARTWVQILMDFATASILVEKLEVARSQGGLETEYRSSAYLEALKTFQIPSERAYQIWAASHHTKVELFAWRAGIDKIANLATIAIRLIASSGGRSPSPSADTMLPEEREVFRQLGYFRRHNQFMAIGGVFRDTEVLPLPLYINEETRSNMFLPVPQVGIEQILDEITSAPDNLNVEQGLYDTIVSFLASKAKVGGAALASSAIEGISDSFKQTGPGQFISTVLNGVGTLANISVAVFSKLWDLLPVLTPLFSLFAAWRFTVTGHIGWGILSVVAAITAGKKVCEWFQNNISPYIYRALKEVSGPTMCSMGVNTDIDMLTLESVDEEPEPVTILGLLLDRFMSATTSTPSSSTSRTPRATAAQDEEELFTTEQVKNEEAPVPEFPPLKSKAHMPAEILASLVSTALLTTGLFLRDANGIVTLFAKYNAVTIGVAGLIKMFVSIASYVIEYGETNVALTSLPLEGKDFQVAAFIDDLKKVFELNAKELIPKTPMYAAHIEELEQKARVLLSHASGSPLNSILLSKIRDLEKIRLAIRSKIGKTGLTKPEPCVCAFIGPPGTNKSLTIIAVAQVVARKLLSDSGQEELLETLKFDSGAIIFNKPAGKHWDGISEQTLILIEDEWLQQDPTTADGSLGTEFVNYNNGMRWNPPMAKLDYKNNVFVRHVLTLLSSNATRIDDKTMLSPEAIIRRLELMFEPVIDPNLPKQESFDPTKAMYRPLVVDKGRAIHHDSANRDMTFMEVVHAIVLSIRARKKFFDLTEATIESVAAKFALDESKTDEIQAIRKRIAEARRRAALSDSERQAEDAKMPATFPSPTVPQVGVVEEVEYGFASSAEPIDFETPTQVLQHFDAEIARKRHFMSMAAIRGVPIQGEDLDRAYLVFQELYAQSGLEDYFDLMQEFVFSQNFELYCAPCISVPGVQQMGADDVQPFYTRWRSSIGDTLEKAKSFFMEHGYAALTGANFVAILTGIATALGLYKYWDRYMTAYPNYMKKGSTKKEKNTNRAAQAARIRALARANMKPVEQASMASLEISTIIESNRYHLTTVREKSGKKFLRKMGYANGVMDRYFVMPFHFWVELQLLAEDPETQDLKLRMSNGTHDYEFPLSDVRLIDDGSEVVDRCIIKVLHKNFAPVRNVIKHYATEHDLKNAFKTISAGTKAVYLDPKMPLEFNVRPTPVIDIYSLEGEHLGKRINMISYLHATQNGDCGTPLISSNGSTSGKVFGFHTHGNGRQGHATQVSTDYLRKVILKAEPEMSKEAPSVYQELVTAPVVQEIGLNFFPEGVDIWMDNVVPVSSVHMKNDDIPWSPNPGDEPKERVMVASDVSKERFGPNRARFSPQTVVNEGYSKSIDAIAADIANLFKKAGGLGRDLRVWTFEEAVGGIKSMGVAPLRVHQAAGYPIAAMGFGRADYFYIDEEGDYIPREKWPELAADVAHLEWLGKTGSPLPVIWQTFLKAEKIKKKKFDEGKTRDVNCAPLAFLVLCRMYMGDAVQLIIEGSSSNECLISVDADSAQDWDFLAKKLQSKSGGRNCDASDYAAYDHSHSSLTMSLPRKVFRLLYDSIGEQQSRVLENIFKAVSEPLLIFGSAIEKRNGTMPSGFYGTTVSNCIINMGNLRFAWITLHQMDLTSLLTFKDEVACEFCGDDLIYEVSDEYCELYTPKFLSEVVATLGYTLTAADKTACKEALSPLENHTILKRGFRYEPYMGKFLGPLNLDRVLEICMWTKAKDPDGIGATNCEVTLRELSLHGKEIFDQWVPKLVKHGRGFWNPSSTNWETVLSMTTKYGVWGEE